MIVDVDKNINHTIDFFIDVNFKHTYILWKHNHM